MSHSGPNHITLKAGLAYAVLSIGAIISLGRLDAPVKFFHSANKAGMLAGAEPLQSLGLGLLLGGVLALAGEALTRRTAWGRTLSRILRALFGDPHLFDIILLALLSSLGEELLFRGILLPYLGLFGSSLLFGLAHLVPRGRLMLWSVWATAVGFSLGWLAVFSGGLLAPIAAHFTVNAIGLMSLKKVRAP